MKKEYYFNVIKTTTDYANYGAVIHGCSVGDGTFFFFFVIK